MYIQTHNYTFINLVQNLINQYRTTLKYRKNYSWTYHFPLTDTSIALSRTHKFPLGYITIHFPMYLDASLSYVSRYLSIYSEVQ